MGYAAQRAATRATVAPPDPAPSVGEDWRFRALCAHESPDLFFPIGDSVRAAQQVAEAKRVCARCPVQQACLAWALERGPVEGIFGGTDQTERRAMRHRPSASRVGTSPNP